MNKIRKVIELHCNTSLSTRDISRAANLPRSTVNDYIKRFKKSAIKYTDFCALTEPVMYQHLFPDADKKAPANQKGKGKVKPDFSMINRELKKKGVTRQLLWEEYKIQYPGGMGYTQFCYHLNQWQKKLNVSMRQIHKAGEKLFVDYSGLKGEIIDAQSGEIREVDIFVATLGASAYTYAEASKDQKQESFINAQINAFEFFEGVPELLVPDNLKPAVTKAHRYDPLINETYQDMADHYNTVVIPARPYSPQDKSKVELAVKLVQRWILAKIRKELFFSVEDLNRRIRELLDHYNSKVIRQLGKSRKELFMDLDKPALKALPLKRYEFKRLRWRRVNMDYHVEIEGAYYSVPYQLAGQEVLLKYNQRIVCVSYQNKVVALHVRIDRKGQAVTLKEHMPKAHQRYAETSPSMLIEKGRAVGPNTERLIHKIITEDKHPEKGYRSAYGILTAAQKHKNNHEAELASAKMLAMDIKRTFHYESILRRKSWQIKDDDPVLLPKIKTKPENIRGNEYFK